LQRLPWPRGHGGGHDGWTGDVAQPPSTTPKASSTCWHASRTSSSKSVRRTVTLTLDGACLFSPTHYEYLFLPFDQRLCEAFETPFVHLHAAARQHFDAWTEISSLGLQCVIDQACLPEGRNQLIGPQIPDLLADFARIRRRKSLMLYGFWTEAWLRAVRDGLPASGCAITGMAQDQESLRRLLAGEQE